MPDSNATDNTTVNPAIAFLVQDPLSEEDDDGDTSFQADGMELDSEGDSSDSDSDNDNNEEEEEDASASDDNNDDKDMLSEIPTAVIRHSKVLAGPNKDMRIETWALDPAAPENVQDEHYVVMRQREIEEEYRKRLEEIAKGKGKGKRDEVDEEMPGQEGGGEGLGEEGVERMTI